LADLENKKVGEIKINSVLKKTLISL